MRYLNWDVLLFPGSSRVPLQEFDTKCHVLPDPSNRSADGTLINNDPYHGGLETTSQIPVLTSFISSLESGAPFRVSVHSWEAPKPSQTLQTFKTKEEVVAYEARIYIDGNMVARRVFDDQAIWPEVIESTDDADTTHTKPIRFPIFHSEILDQAHWEPGEAFGRIKVVIAEGVFDQKLGRKPRSTFDRLGDIIWFSFQHAPRHILEYSAIAWPNARLFRKGARSLHGNMSNRTGMVPDFEAHAHSPQRKQDHSLSMALFGPNVPTFPAQMSHSIGGSGFEDPFIGPTPISLRQNRSQMRNNSNDISMQDYNSIRTVRSHAGTDMSGLSYQKPDFERTMNQAAIEEIVRSLSPERKHDLFQALSPDKTQTSLNNQAPFMNEAIVEGDEQESREGPATLGLFQVQPRPAGSQHTIATRNGLLASRYATVPLLTGGTIRTEDKGRLRGLRSSVDPILPTQWKQTSPYSSAFGLEATSSLLEPQAGSSSNGSKRKRLHSPSVIAQADSSKIPSMSTSPCKQDTIVSNQIDYGSPAETVEGGVLLNKQE